jgi:hypothetical protein
MQYLFIRQGLLVSTYATAKKGLNYHRFLVGWCGTHSGMHVKYFYLKFKSDRYHGGAHESLSHREYDEGGNTKRCSNGSSNGFHSTDHSTSYADHPTSHGRYFCNSC